MREIERINDQLRRAFAGKAWHGPAVTEALESITCEQAASRPVANAHSIWELTNHIGAWADIVRRAALGEKFEITDALNFPSATDTSEAAWQASLQKLQSIHEALTVTVAGLPESRLDEPVLERSSTVYVLLHGVAQHHACHAGQIVLLKKLL